MHPRAASPTLTRHICSLGNESPRLHITQHPPVQCSHSAVSASEPAAIEHLPSAQELAGALVSVAQACAQAGQGTETKERLARAVHSLQRIVQLPGAPTPLEGTPCLHPSCCASPWTWPSQQGEASCACLAWLLTVAACSVFAWHLCCATLLQSCQRLCMRHCPSEDCEVSASKD